MHFALSTRSRSTFLVLLLFITSGCGDNTGQQFSENIQNNTSKTTTITGNQSRGINQASGLINIAVLATSDFFPDRAVQQRKGLPENLAARIIEHLQNSKRFNVLERTVLRKTINEQQFQKENEETSLEKALDAITENLSDISGIAVKWSGIHADHNDIVKEYQNLGTIIGADYLVFAVLEKVEKDTQSRDVPYSQTNRKVTENVTDSRLWLRIVDAKTGVIAGTTSFRSKLSESIFEDTPATDDALSNYDHVGAIAAQKILDIVSPATIVSTNPYVVNRGSNDGYTPDMTLKVIREGKEIFDPSGIAIGHIKSDIGTIKVAIVQETISIVDIVDGKITEGDLIAEIAQQSKPQPSSKTNQAGKLTLAIGKVHFNLVGNSILLSTYDYPRIKNDLMVKLTNTNRFDILERHEIDQILDEKTFSAIMAGEEINQHLQELIQADYLVLTSVDKFLLQSESKSISFIEDPLIRHNAIVEATMRIVNSHTGKLLAADKIRINKKLKKSNNNNPYSNLIDELTNLMVAKLLNRIYPIKIIAVLPDNSVYINRGEDGGLISGDLFTVMRPGEEIIDPDTGLSFGTTETKVAELKLDVIESFRAKANIISGNTVVRGDILRNPIKNKKTSAPVTVNKPNF